jgi:hypothetical protein
VPLANVLPEPGQVVEVRGSTWAAANVQAQGLPRSPGDEETPHLNHVVDLQSLDEDRLGREIATELRDCQDCTRGSQRHTWA